VKRGAAGGALAAEGAGDVSTHHRRNSTSRAGRGRIPTLLVAAVLVAAGLAAGAGASAPTPPEPPASVEPAHPRGALTARERRNDPLALADEVEELRTRTSRTWVTPSGSYRSRIYSGPVNFRDGSQWRTIDNRLERSGEGFRNRANSYSVEIPAELGGAPVRASAGGHSIAFRLRGGDGPASVDGSTATFRDAIGSVDVAYSAEPDRVKETLTLDSADAPTRYVFDLDVSEGLSPRATDAGAIELRDAQGRLHSIVEPPFMQDASGGPASISRAVSMELERAGDGWTVTLEADRRWIEASERRFPVVIDPTLSFQGADQDCEIAGGSSASTNFCGYAEIFVGRRGTGTPHRGLVEFELAPIIARDVEVLNAELGMYLLGSETSTATTVDAHAITRQWTGGIYGATWNTYDGTNAWTTPGGDFKSDAAGSASNVAAAGKHYHWPVTSAVRGWIRDKATNHGFLLKERTEGSNVLYFGSSYHKSAGARPYLDVTYEPRAGLKKQWEFEEQQLTDRLSMGVNVASGNLMLEESDLTIPGTGMALSVSRHYNNLSPNTGPSGGGWAMSTGWDVALTEFRNGDVAFYAPSGAPFLFEKRADGSYTKPSGLNAKLDKKTAGGWTLTDNKSEQRYEFDAEGFLTEQRDKNDRKITFAYNSYKDLTSITDTQGRQTTFTHDRYGYVTGMRDPAGRTYTYTIKDMAGKGTLVSYTDPAGKVTQYTYDNEASYNLVKVTTPGGRSASFTYDARFRVTSVTRDAKTTTYAYEQGGTKCGDDDNTVVTDPRGNKTTYCWDEHGRVDTVYDALGRKRSRKYDSQSNVVEVSGASGGASTPAYSTKAEFDANDNLTSIEDPGQTDGTGALSTFSYGSGGGLDAFRLREATDPEGNKRNFNYDTSGNLTEVGTVTKENAAEKLVTLQYNGKADGDCADQADAPNGTLRCSVDGNGNRTLYGHDAKGNMTRIDPPSPLGARTYVYDAISRPTSMTDGKGQQRTFTYDARDRLTKVEFRDTAGIVRATVSYVYDADGNRTSRTDARGTTTYSYDARGLLTREAFPDGTSNAYAYDAAGNMASMTDPGGTTLYAYDAVNLLSQLTDPDGGVTTYGYNDDNSRTRATYPNGVTEARTYNKAQRVIGVEAKTAGGTLLTDFEYDYLRSSGRDSYLRQKMVDKQRGTTTVYGYDHLGRLISQDTTGAATERYAYRYDANSNRLYESDENGAVTSYSYNSANQLTSAGGVTYSYDANGNLTGSSSGWSLAYNVLNQTTSIDPPGSGGAQQLGYLGIGQTEMVERAGVRYTNNGLWTGQSFGARGAETYVREPSGVPHSQKSAAGRHYYVFDAHPMSVAGLTNGSGGMAARYRYDPFGQVESATGTLDNPIRFASAEHVPALGLYKMGERWYDPKLGRFTQQDPLNQPLDARQANRYLYAGQDPVNLADPSGQHIVEDAWDYVEDRWDEQGDEIVRGVRKWIDFPDRVEAAWSCGSWLGGSTEDACDPFEVFGFEVEPAY
jgi:RHS repeat-associated protein